MASNVEKEPCDTAVAAALGFIAVLSFLLGVGLCLLLEWVRQCP